MWNTIFVLLRSQFIDSISLGACSLDLRHRHGPLALAILIPAPVLHQTLHSNPIISWTLIFILSTYLVLVTTPHRQILITGYPPL